MKKMPLELLMAQKQILFFSITGLSKRINTTLKHLVTEFKSVI